MLLKNLAVLAVLATSAVAHGHGHNGGGHKSVRRCRPRPTGLRRPTPTAGHDAGPTSSPDESSAVSAEPAPTESSAIESSAIESSAIESSATESSSAAPSPSASDSGEQAGDSKGLPHFGEDMVAAATFYQRTEEQGGKSVACQKFQQAPNGNGIAIPFHMWEQGHGNVDNSPWCGARVSVWSDDNPDNKVTAYIFDQCASCTKPKKVGDQTYDDHIDLHINTWNALGLDKGTGEVVVHYIIEEAGPGDGY